MSDLPSSAQKIQLEQTQQRAPVSESLMQGIGGSINLLLSQILPVGSVVATMLNEVTFQSQMSVGWVLANGANVAGSSYETLSGFTNIPDLRGVWIRGKNNGRSGASGNPSGDVALGAYEGDDFKAHTHSISWKDDTGNAGEGIEVSPDVGGNRSSSIIVASNVGGAETRVRSVTVNYMIRIN